jgi:hypothetical protein
MGIRDEQDSRQIHRSVIRRHGRACGYVKLHGTLVLDGGDERAELSSKHGQPVIGRDVERAPALGEGLSISPRYGYGVSFGELDASIYAPVLESERGLVPNERRF